MDTLGAGVVPDSSTWGVLGRQERAWAALQRQRMWGDPNLILKVLGRQEPGLKTGFGEAGALILERASGHFCFLSWELDWKTFRVLSNLFIFN